MVPRDKVKMEPLHLSSFLSTHLVPCKSALRPLARAGTVQAVVRQGRGPTPAEELPTRHHHGSARRRAQRAPGSPVKAVGDALTRARRNEPRPRHTDDSLRRHRRLLLLRQPLCMWHVEAPTGCNGLSTSHSLARAPLWASPPSTECYAAVFDVLGMSCPTDRRLHSHTRPQLHNAVQIPSPPYARRRNETISQALPGPCAHDATNCLMESVCERRPLFAHIAAACAASLPWTRAQR